MRYLLALLFLFATSATYGADKAATVDVGGCSGVNVHPNGLIFTAWHCSHPPLVTIKFPSGKTYKAIKVFEGKSRDGVVAFAILNQKNLPYAPIAKDDLKVGDEVYSYGYPKIGKTKSLKFGKGKVLHTDVKASIVRKPVKSKNPNYDVQYLETFSADKDLVGKFIGTVTSILGKPGWSGGPLFNKHGEVCGLLTGGNDKDSIFMQRSYVSEAYQAFKDRKLNIPLIMFTAPGCQPCVKVKAAYAAGKFGELKLQFITWGTPAYKLYANAAFEDTGKKIEYVPTFWVPGSKKLIPYNVDPITIAKLIRLALKQVLDIIIGKVEERQNEIQPVERNPSPSVPERKEPSLPSDKEVTTRAENHPIWEGTKALILIQKFSGEGDDPRKDLALHLAKGKVHAIVNEVTGGKTEVYFVPERTEKDRYDAIVSMASLSPERVNVVILVPRKNHGFIKNIAVGKIENKILARFGKVPRIHIVFERLDTNQYNQLTSLALMPPPESSIKNDLKEIVKNDLKTRMLDWLAAGTLGGGGVGGLAAGVAWWRRRKNKKGEVTKSTSA